jgi:hypothetical protein
LPEVAEKYDKKMVDYDIELIRNIPVIIGAENQNLNFGGADFKVKESGTQ